MKDKIRIDQTITYFYEEDYHIDFYSAYTTGQSSTTRLKSDKVKLLQRADVAILVKNDGREHLLKSRYD